MRHELHAFRLTGINVAMRLEIFLLECLSPGHCLKAQYSALHASEQGGVLLRPYSAKPWHRRMS